MDLLTHTPTCIVVTFQTPETILILTILCIFILMNLLLYITNRKLCIEALSSQVYVVKYESHPFLRYGVVHCVSLQGHKIRLIDPGFVFRKHVQKITPRELNTLKFRIEFHWRLILTIDIKIMELYTESMGIKTRRGYDVQI